MSSSLEKIEDFAGELLAPPPEDAEILELAMRSLVQMAYPQFRELLPEDPLVLDRALEEIAARLLAMRSDGAPALAIAGSATEAPRELAAGE